MLNTRLPKTTNGLAGLVMSGRHHTPQVSPKRHQFVTSLLLASCAALLLLLPAPLQCQSSYQMHHEPVAFNEINLHSHQKQPVVNSSHQHRSREVKNLRLIPELRSIRLRWDYEREELKVGKENDWPASFRIRFCELTSWQAEIKCRQKDMQVQQRVNDANSPEVSPAASPADEVKLIAASGSAARVAPQQLAPHQDNSTVIQLLGQSQELSGAAMQHRERRHPAKDEPSRCTYEAQIFDLRALTSYTFNVQVLRFSSDDGGGGSSDSKEDSQLLAASTSRPASGGRPARRLDLVTPTGPINSNGNELIPASRSQVDSADKQRQQAAGVRAETKPFSAEALKCLANSSEVLVNTGRYFGGRISVEGTPNGPAAAAAAAASCQLLGNRSSPQSAYLFRIDHELCHSKVLDSQRIETMILVHENKDLLTHNTARFLIQCNISQRTFTVRASVSLPKVNGLTTAAAAAAGAATTTTTSDNANGLQRAVFRPAIVTAVASPQQASARRSNEELVRLGSMPGVFRSLQRANLAHLAPVESESQLHSSAIGASNERAAGGRRQSKELQQAMPQALVLPRPVDVSSGLLFVGRKHDVDEPSPSHAATREARLLTAKPNEQIERVSTAAMVVEQQQQQQRPIVMTNNHRVAGNFLPLAQAVANLERRAKSASGGDPLFSIKYSPENVSEYSLARMVVAHDDDDNDDDDGASPRATDNTPTTTTTNARSRSGRMRQIDQQPRTTAAPTTTRSPAINHHGFNRVESRMGESRQAAGARVGLPADSMSAAESSIENRVSMSATSVGSANQTAPGTSAGGQAPTVATSVVVVTNPTLAQNITGALLRWSLKTLGNLARKSLDALASEPELAAPASRVESVVSGEMPPHADGANAEEEEDATQTNGRSKDSPPTPRPVGAITKIHESELDGFLVERRKTTKQPWVQQSTIAHQEAKGQTGTTASIQQQQVRTATQSADLSDSRKPHQLEAPPGLPRQPPTIATTTTTSTPTSTSIRPTKKHRSSPRDWYKQKANGHPRFSATSGDDASSLLPPSEDQSGAPSSSPSQANTVQTPTSSPSSSLWPIYCLWSLVGLLGLVTLAAFLLVSNRGRRASTTSGSFHPSLHHQRAGPSPAGILAQINEAIHRHHHSATSSRVANDPPPGLASQGEVYVQAKQQQHVAACLIQSPSVQRRDLTLGTTDGNATPTLAQAQRHQFASVSHVVSPGGGSATSAASTRSTSAASTANMSSQLGGGSGSDSAHIAFSDSSSGANSVSPDHSGTPDQHTYRSQAPHESYCKNHEQFVYTDYLLLSDSDCLTNNCRGESFA